MPGLVPVVAILMSTRAIARLVVLVAPIVASPTLFTIGVVAGCGEDECNTSDRLGGVVELGLLENKERLGDLVRVALIQPA